MGLTKNQHPPVHLHGAMAPWSRARTAMRPWMRYRAAFALALEGPVAHTRRYAGTLSACRGQPGAA